MINYHGSQKAVVRVNPFVPLQTLLPLICEKCDFDPAHVLLLKDSVSRYELQLDKSLTDLEIKELYVHDQSLGNFSLTVSAAMSHVINSPGLWKVYFYSVETENKIYEHYYNNEADEHIFMETLCNLYMFGDFNVKSGLWLI